MTVVTDTSDPPRLVTPTPPAIDTCNTCRFWQSADVTEWGRCHFNAPIIPDQVSAQTFWPKTMPTDWCGQYAARV